jgi:hypothetical protein
VFKALEILIQLELVEKELVGDDYQFRVRIFIEKDIDYITDTL